MYTLEQARQAWTIFRRYNSLDELRNGVRLDEAEAKSPATLRSVCWKAFLFFESVGHDQWSPSLDAARAAYEALRTRFSSAAVADKLGDDPLADGVEVCSCGG